MDLNSALAGSAVAALFLAAAVWRPSIARVALFLLFFASAIFNAIVTYPARDHIFVQMVGGPYVPQLYRDFTLAFVIQNPTLFTLLLVAFELAIACLVLTRGAPVKLALVSSAAWLLTMWLFAPPEGIVFTAIAQIGSAVGCILMLRRDFPAAIPEIVASRFHRRAEPAAA